MDDTLDNLTQLLREQRECIQRIINILDNGEEKK